MWLSHCFLHQLSCWWRSQFPKSATNKQKYKKLLSTMTQDRLNRLLMIFIKDNPAQRIKPQGPVKVANSTGSYHLVLEKPKFDYLKKKYNKWAAVREVKNLKTLLWELLLSFCAIGVISCSGKNLPYRQFLPGLWHFSKFFIPYLPITQTKLCCRSKLWCLLSMGSRHWSNKWGRKHHISRGLMKWK